MSAGGIIAVNIVFGLVSWAVVRTIGRCLPKGGEGALWCALSLGLFAAQGWTAFGVVNLCSGLICGCIAVRDLERGMA